MFSVIKEFWHGNPIKIAASVRAIILVATSFGLEWTADQVAAVMIAVEAILALFTDKIVTSNVQIDSIVSDAVTNAVKRDRAFQSYRGV